MSSRHVILYRDLDFGKDELEAARPHFYCTSLRPQLQKGDFIIGRYSLWPYYADQEKEFRYIGAKLINSYDQHSYIADLINYTEDLKELTPKTWYSLHEVPNEGPFVLKGGTNSKKHKWNEMMFAKDKQAAIEVHGRLQEDGLIGHQHIYIRKYEPLVTYTTAIGGIPITKEFRFFIAYGEILCGDYYWSNYSGDIDKPSVDEVPKEFLDEAINRIGNKVNFYAMDVAQKQDGTWIVIELNDGQYSGLSDNDTKILYSRLKEVLVKKGL